MATYKILHRNRVEVTVPNVLSETQVDDTVYDLTNYRDDPVEMLAYPVASGSAVAAATASDTNMGGPLLVYTGHARALQAAGVASATPALYASDKITHEPPRFEAKKRTKLKLWSQAAGAGDLLWSGWVDRLESWGVSTASTNV